MKPLKKILIRSDNNKIVVEEELVESRGGRDFGNDVAAEVRSGGAESEVSSSEEVDADDNAGEDADSDSESGAYVDVEMREMILEMTIWLKMRICRVHVHASEV